MRPRPVRIPPRLAHVAMTLALSAAAAPERLQGQGAPADRTDEEAFLRAVGEDFGLPATELEVLRRWGLAAAEIPVVLFVARRAGVSPDVVVTQRSGGESWMTIATRYSLHAGDFHVRLGGPYGALAEAYHRFDALPAARWREITLSDAEVAGLVNARFLARHLQVSPSRAARELADGDAVGAFARLRGPP